MKQIVIVGGGYAGFYAAWRLEKKLRRDEAAVTVVDPAPYMTYQPFLPEVAAGSIEARHAIVPLRRHLRHTVIVSGRADSRSTTRHGRCTSASPTAPRPRSPTTRSSSPPER